MARKKLRIWLDESDYLALKKVANFEKKPISEFVREAITGKSEVIIRETSGGMEEKLLAGMEEKLLIFSEVLIKNFFNKENPGENKKSDTAPVSPEVVKFLVQKIAYMNTLLIELNGVTAPVSTSAGEKRDSILRAKLANGAAENAMKLFEKG